jgi:hypothetical protein
MGRIKRNILDVSPASCHSRPTCRGFCPSFLICVCAFMQNFMIMYLVVFEAVTWGVIEIYEAAFGDSHSAVHITTFRFVRGGWTT